MAALLSISVVVIVNKNNASNLVGIWRVQDGGCGGLLYENYPDEITFYDNNTAYADTLFEGTWEVKGNKLYFTVEALWMEFSYEYKYKLSGNQLTLTFIDGDEVGEPVVYVRNRTD